MPDDDTVVVEQERDEAESVERRPAGRRWLPVLLGALVVAALVVAAVQTARLGSAERRVDSVEARLADLDDAEVGRTEVADVAGRFGVALLTYDYQDLNAARQRVLALATDRFGREYTDAFVNGLDDAITQFEAVADATLVDVYVGAIEGDAAQVVVTLDSQVQSTEGTRRTVSSYLDLRLVREAGAWRVDVATSLAALDEQTTPAPGG
ncbi:MAG: hypothetical protein H0W25_12765 [Acidimicrobiia bacterium]|nr:hypothetical protein [Acidimicrobiia bacterium]